MRYPTWILAGLLLATAAGADSLFTTEVADAGTLVSDKKASFKVGEIITVLVRESIDASTQSNLDTRKESEIDMEAPPASNPFLIAETPGGLNILPAEQLPNVDIQADTELRATGRTLRQNRLVTTVSCRVIEVLENGNVRIQGRKRVTVNREDSELFVSGIVRARDVSPANTVSSLQLTDAVVELKGRGPLWNNTRRGLLTRIFDWISIY